MRFDDLYNNFKIIEQEVKRTVTTSSSTGSQNMAFLSSPGSTNEIDTDNIQVSTVSAPVITVNTHDNTTNLSDATVYAFQANQPNGSQLKTGKKITINGSDTAGYDKTKVECFNCHKMGHFARECKSTRNQESRRRNQDNSRKTVIVEDTFSKALVEIDRSGFDWSYMANDQVPTNMALMAFSDLETKIHVDNESAICVVKNLVYHSKTKHIEIRHHFNRDSYEKRLIEMVKIHTDYNVADLLTKAFDVTRF
nr:putative ribonuclease H-like domain-containing protein [Tanacetum cinerariifolium]